MENNESQYGQMNFNLPHDVVPLPSQGLFYKNKKKAIKVGYLTAQDENLLMSNNLQGSDLITQLIRTKIYEPDMRIDDMLTGDIEAVLIFLRNTAFGTKYQVSAVDPKTNQRFDVTLDLGELNIKNIKNTPDSNGLFTLTLPMTKDTVQYKLLTYGEDAQIDKELDRYPNGVIKPVITRKLEKQIVSVNGSNDVSTIAKFVTEMPIADSKYLRRTIAESEPRLDLKKEVQTPTGDIIDVFINFGVEFFRPFFSIQ